MSELAERILRWRAEAAESAAGFGAAVVALATSPLPVSPSIDARLSHRYPTVEIRVADVCLDPADTALPATLVRGLVETAARSWRAGEPPDALPVSLLRTAAWQAARSGLEGCLLHPLTMRPEPSKDVVDALLAHVRDALEDSCDLAAVNTALGAVASRGSGARVQRRLMAKTASLRAAVVECVARTRG